MINVRCLGHIRTAVGSEEIQLDLPEIGAAEIIERLRLSAIGKDPGFSRYNTLVMVDDGEAFVPATSNRIVKNGEHVVLIPFSHGG